jgi:WD40 repeat protein
MRKLIPILLLCFATTLQAQQPELTVQLGHSQLIYDVAYSPNGAYIASASADRTVKIWEAGKGRELRTIYIAIGYATSVAFSPDNKFLLIGGGDYDNGVLQMYNIETGALVSNFLGHNEYTWTAGFSSDGKNVYSASFDGTIKLWEAATGKMLFSTKDLNSICRDLSIDPKGEWVATTSDKDSIGAIIWSAKDLSFVKRINTPIGIEPRSIAFSANGNYIIVGDYAQNIVVFERNGNEPLYTIEAHNDNIQAVTSDPTEETFFSCAMDKLIHQWDLKTGAFIQTFEGHKDRVYSIHYHPSEEKLLSGGSFDKSVLEWDVATAKVLKKYNGNIYPIQSLSLNNNGRQLLIAANDDFGGDVYAWDLDRLNKMENIGDPQSVYHYFDFFNDTILIAGAVGNIEMRSLHDNRIYDQISYNNGLHQPIFSNQGKDLILGRATSIEDSWSTFYDLRVLNLATLKENPFTTAFQKMPGNQYLQLSEDEKTAFIFESNWYENRFYLLNRSNSKIEYSITDTIRNNPIFEVSPNGKYLVLASHGKIGIWDLHQHKFLFDFENLPKDYPRDIVFINNDELFISGGEWSSGFLTHFSISQQKIIQQKTDFTSAQSALAFDETRKLIYCGSEQGKISVFNSGNFELQLTLFAFADENNEWAAIHPSGLFDGSKNGIEKYLYFTFLLEPIELFQLKERYYEPGLIQKVLGFNPEPMRNVQSFSAVKLYPKAQLEMVGEELTIRLLERSGGIGKIAFFINGKEMLKDISNRFVSTANGPMATVSLTTYDKFMLPQQANTIEVVTSNIDNSMTSPVYSIKYVPKAKTGFGAKISQPKLHALVVGTSDYRGTELDLNFAAKDAADFAQALEIGGKPLFGVANVNIYLLSTDQIDSTLRPTKTNIYQTLSKIAETAGPEDILLLYFSGHGVTYGSPQSAFYYLTQEVSTGDLNDAFIRENYAISTNDLVDWINAIAAQKQILVLDACASGQVVEDVLTLSKNVQSSQIKALDKMKDRTGLYIIAGSASNKVSYEASQYGQSLLTYSLLSGLNILSAKDEARMIDLVDWMNYSKEQVPELAGTIGGVQEPVVALPRNLNSFDILNIPEDNMVKIASVKPIFIRSNFLEATEHEDVLQLSAQLDHYFQDISSKGKLAHLIYVDVPTFPEAYSIKGIYTLLTNGSITLQATVRKGSLRLGKIEVNGKLDKLEQLLEDLIGKVDGLVVD